jgi:2-oxoglutarate ferredoxin oxidoreductase subunit gamma
MKYYIIFNSKGKYIGYTTNKKLLNAFLQERGESKYKVEKINEENLSEQMKKTIKSSFSDLYYLYITDKEKIAIFSNEDASFETHMIESMIRSRSSLDRLLKSNKLLKLSEDDQKVLNILLAGFGGQGILFAGKVIAYAGLMDEKEISWLPSYGPEMRGGTANCSICLSDKPIGSPLVVNPNVFVAMNLPSFDKFIDAVEPNGIVLIDSSRISKKVERTDLNVFYVPASDLAEKNGINGLANIILVGKLFKELGFSSREALDKAIAKCIPARKADMLDLNKKAIQLGMEQ